MRNSANVDRMAPPADMRNSGLRSMRSSSVTVCAGDFFGSELGRGHAGAHAQCGQI